MRRRVTALLSDADLRGYYLAYLGLFFTTAVYSQTLPLYFREVGVSLAVLGVAKSAGNVVQIAAEPVTGVLADRFDRAGMAAIAAAGLGLLLAALPVADTAGALAALVVLVGLARLGLVNALTPAVNEALGTDRAGLGWGLRDLGIYAGSAIGLAVGGTAVVVAGPIAAAFLPLVPVSLGVGGLLWRRRTRAGGAAVTLSAVRERLRAAAPVAAFRGLSSWRTLARFCAIEALVSLGAGMSLFLLPAFAVDVGVPTGAVLFVFAGYNLLAAPVSLGGGLLADRYAARRKWLYAGNYAAEAAMLLAFAAAFGVPLFLVGLALYVAQTAFEPAVMSYFFGQFPEEEAGRAWSVEGTVSRAASVLAPGIGGVLYAVDPRLPFLLGAALTAGATLIALTLPE